MVTSSTLKTLKEQDGPIGPRQHPVPGKVGGRTNRLQTWWRGIWRRRWLSVITAWLICVVGWGAITLWPTSYIASAVIYADLSHLLDNGATSNVPEQTPAAMLKGLLLSDDALDEVGDQLTLDETGNGSLQDDIMLRSTVPPVFVLSYEHKSPDRAQQVLETVIANYQARLDQASATAIKSVTDLEQQIEEHESTLETAEADLEAFKSTNADYLQNPDSRLAELALLEEEIFSLEGQVNAAIAARDDVAARLARATDDATETADAEAPRSLDELELERTALDEELAKLQERYADSHPYVIAVFDAIRTLDAEVELLTEAGDGENATDEAPIDREELEQRHGELIVEVSELNSRLEPKRREIDRLQALTRVTTSVEAELSELEAKKKELTTALSDLKRSREELGGNVGGEATQEAFRLIREPDLPTDPVGPSRLMALAAVLLGGTGLGAAVAVFCNRLKGVFESAWQLKKRFDVGVLGTISEVMTPAERKQLSHSRLAFGLACLALIGAFSGLVIAEMTDRLAPLGDQLRQQILG